jgi:NO-binding membrane sensor protein with MHYT domain
MGGIAIWSMHYLGNRALVLGDGAGFLQISYAPGFTAASFFLSVSMLFIAFCVVESNRKIRYWRILLAGWISGMGIAG